MTVASTCEKLNELITKVRTPMTQIPAILIACSAIQRPGLSPMLIASNIIRRLPEADYYFGPLADGSPNRTEALIVIAVEEIVKAIKEDLWIQGAIPAGGATMVGTAATAGGPAPVTVTNAAPIKVVGFGG